MKKAKSNARGTYAALLVVSVAREIIARNPPGATRATIDVVALAVVTDWMTEQPDDEIQTAMTNTAQGASWRNCHEADIVDRCLRLLLAIMFLADNPKIIEAANLAGN